MNLPLTRDKLDAAKCGCCGKDQHGPLYLNQRCHPNAGTDAFYDRKTGNVTIECRECKMAIVQIRVARELVEA
jgi:hypothetical protein